MKILKISIGTASFSGILLLGGPGGIVAKSYHYSTADGSVQTNYIISDDCIPILEVAKASLTEPITETTFAALAYGNTTLGIKDPSIFDVPANCPQEASLKLPVNKYVSTAASMIAQCISDVLIYHYR